MTARVLFWGRGGPLFWDELVRQAPPQWQLTRLADVPAGDVVAERRMLANVDALVALRRLSGEDLAHATDLGFVQYLGVGVDAFDTEAMRNRGIGLAVNPAGMAVPLAEHTLLLILATLRRLPDLMAGVASGTWPQWEHRGRSRSLAGRRVGLVGFGRSAQRVAELLLACDASVFFLRRSSQPLPPHLEGRVTPASSLLDLARSVDVLSLHVPLSPATRHLIDGAVLAAMPPGAVLVNTARGGVVDQAALRDALASGHLGGAGLDVVDPEPLDDTELLQLPNVLVTPHVSTGTRDAAADKVTFAIDNIHRYLDGTDPTSLVVPVGRPAAPRLR